jgi:alcohol dehydrogenase/propanol-preferring alcohol dehydrogenase
MRAAVVEKAKAERFIVQEKSLPEPAQNQVRIKVHACGVCHSDLFTKEGVFPGIQYPISPGHEVAGVIDKVGPGVLEWKEGDRVGVGWHGGHCFQCERCRRGDFMTCKHEKICGISYNGGYSNYITAPFEALAHIPDELSFEEAAPLMCAGITTYNPLRNSDAKPGDVVAVQGLGGLGHLGVQFANKMGFKVVALSSGADKKELAKKLGAHVYVDVSKEDAVKVLQSLGGAKVILATAPQADTISPLTPGLSPDGRIIVVGISHEPIKVGALDLIGARRGVVGWPSGTAIESEDTLKFAALTGVRAMIETFPIEHVNEAYEKMLTNKVRFRAVLKFE